MENELKKLEEFAGLTSGLTQAARCAVNLKAMGVDPGANICDILTASLLAARANVLAIEGTMKELGCDIPE